MKFVLVASAVLALSFISACSSSGGLAGDGGTSLRRSDGGARGDGGASFHDDGGTDVGADVDGGSEVGALDGGATDPTAGLDGGTFGTCIEALQCYLACDTHDTRCVDACLAATRPSAAGIAGTVRDCLVSHCSNQSGAALRSCAQTQCPSPYAQCQQAECAGASRLVYVVDQTNRLLSFDPTNASAPFHQIGTLNCGGFGAMPFSMSVDRTGRAWVLYTDGYIYWVNTATAACQRSGYQPSFTALQFGMGFAISPTGGGERLYVAVDATTPRLESIDPNALTLGDIGALPVGEYSPELSGTAAATLYAYYPGARSSFVAKIDPTTGRSLQQWSVPTLSGSPIGWAFAHWGGKFYIFVTDGTAGSLSGNSKIIVLDPSTGDSSVMMENLPYVIVGAGVSICAPIK